MYRLLDLIGESGSNGYGKGHPGYVTDQFSLSDYSR